VKSFVIEVFAGAVVGEVYPTSDTKSGAVYGEKQGTETTDGGRNYNSAMCEQSDIYNLSPGSRTERGLGTSSQQHRLLQAPAKDRPRQ